MLLVAQWIEKDGKITNKETKKDLCTEVCEVPKYGIKDYIKVVSSGKVMSLKDYETYEGTEVILETEVAETDKQLWIRSRPTSDGYFTLQSKATSGSDLYLASTGDGKLTNGIAEGPPDIPKGINSILLVYLRKLHIEYFFLVQLVVGNLIKVPMIMAH